MHELSLCRDLVAMVAEVAAAENATKVKTISLELGPFAHIEPNSILFCFDAVAEGTLAAGAKLEIIRTPARALCPKCRHQQMLTERFQSCELCDYFPIELVNGNEFVLKSLEVC